MSSHVAFNDVDDAIKTRLETYWATKMKRLQKLLVPYRPDLQKIHLTVYHHRNSERSWFEVRAAIYLPTGTLAAEANDKDPQAAVDKVTDTLVTEIKRHKEHVRHDYPFKRKNRERGGRNVSGSSRAESDGKSRHQDFFQLVRPHLGAVRDYARRELQSLEEESLVYRRELTVGDLVDEVLSRAWERFSQRPRDQPLDSWLTDTLNEILEDWGKQEPRPHVSLEEKAQVDLPDDAPQKDEPEQWWDALWGDEETFTLEDLIPDESADPSSQLDAAELRERVIYLTNELPRKQRQAFLLQALEGYDPAEIAMIQDRPEGQVGEDIETARRILGERLRQKTTS
jgi:ribosomal subunit interface protein